jgi:ABC-type Zn2+ transport system substrate-binding protein/surface adhesin
MLEGLLGGLVDKEKATRETITNSFEDFAEELQVTNKEMFITIKPVNEKMEFVIHLYKIENGKPVVVREVPLKEITG